VAGKLLLLGAAQPATGILPGSQHARGCPVYVYVLVLVKGCCCWLLLAVVRDYKLAGLCYVYGTVP
jgi:hypothetical protein